MINYKRTLSELKKKAVLLWPQELLVKEADASVLPLLLKTQEKFISVLILADSGPEDWKKFVDISDEMKGNVFLKHLMILSDIGGEALNKYPPFTNFFKDGEMQYDWRKKTYVYKFKIISEKVTLNNKALRADGKSLLKGYVLNPKMEDVIMLLLYGASSIDNTFPDDVKDKCLIGSLIGNPEEIAGFVRQSYIRVSRQIGGAAATKLGKLAEDYVLDILKRELPNWEFNRNGKIPGISHTDGEGLTTFDIVAVSPKKNHFAIEVSFQFTTNGTIQRKAREAKDRAEILHRAGHRICYVIDGAGNINKRERAVQIICDFSDCTVAFSEEEIKYLSQFLKENVVKGS